MIDLYSEWRDFYSKRISSWMSLDELRAECGKLATADNPSPEVLLIHAMHALEELQAEVEKWRSFAETQVELRDEAEDTAEELAKALAELITWIPSADTYNRLGFDPEAPMRALKRAKLAIGSVGGLRHD